MSSLRRASSFLAVAALGGAMALVACKDPKPAPPPEPPKKATPVAETPKPPPPVAEQRAVKECAAPIDLAPTMDVKIGDRSARASGYKLAFTDADADGQLTLGVLGPVNEDSGANLLNLKKYVKFFNDEKADAIVVTGDVGEVADGIARVLKALAESKLPVLVIAGNRECRAEFTDGVATARKDFSYVVNMNEVRAVEFPGATLVSLPGYHDPNFITCATGCQYFKSTVEEVIRVAKESKNPVVLVAHGPPHGESSQALDFATGGGNVGDTEVARALKDGNIPFGVFSNIKEAGARATLDPGGTTLVTAGKPSKSLYLNPGPADTVGWEMNDGSKSVGMAAVMTIKGAEATWKLYRAKPLSAAEKAQAKTLEPPVRPDPAAAGESKQDKEGAAPTPPPGESKAAKAPETP